MHKGLIAITAACLAGCAIPAGQTRPQDYPQWRGPLRDGGAAGFIEPASWPDELTRRWRVEVGDGYATPLVVGDTVYLFSRQGGREVLRVLDAAPGAERWQSSYAAPYTPSSPAAAHGSGPKATPLFLEGKLFTLGVSGIVAAFDAGRGTLLWRTAAPAEPPYFSAAASPIGDTGIVITHPGNYEPLTAFDSVTGAVKWKTGPGGSFMAPAMATLQGVRQVVSVTQGGVIGVSPPDGRLLWRYQWAGGGQGGIMPVIHDGTIIASANTQGVLAIRPILRDGSWTVEKVWETRDAEMYLSHPVVVGETLFGFSRLASGQYFALDLKDGRGRWLGPPRQAANVAVTRAANLLILLEDDAELIVARPSNAGFEPLRRYTVADGATWAQPVISGRRIFIKDVSTVALWTLD